MENLHLELFDLICEDELTYRGMLSIPCFARTLTVGRILDFMLKYGHSVVISKVINFGIWHNISWYRNGKLHRKNGPAIEYQDGFKVYCLNNIRVPEWVVMAAPETITKEQIAQEKNSEVSRAIAERLGWDEYMKRVETVLIHKWFDETTSSHYELHDFKERRGSLQPRLLKMESPELNDGTRPYYIELVPPKAKTCQAARRWQCDPSRPEIQECNTNPELVFEIEA